MERFTLLPETGSRFPARGRSRARASLGRAVALVADSLIGALERARQRRALLRLDDRMLRDIGITQADVIREIEKPSWRP